MIRILLDHDGELLGIICIAHKDLQDLRTGWAMSIDLKDMVFEQNPKRPIDRVIVHYALTHLEALDYLDDYGVDIDSEWIQIAHTLDKADAT